MTKADRPVRRETFTSNRGRPLVIELNQTFLVVREKGRRHGYTVSYSQVFNIGARNQAEATRKAKAEARKARRAK